MARRWLSAFVFSGLAAAAAPSLALEGRVIGSGFEEPVYVAAPKGDERLFVVEKGGKILVINGDRMSTFLDISDHVNTQTERGLLGLAFDPDYATNGRFYVDYIEKTTLDTRIDRYTVSPPNADKADKKSRQKIIVIDQEPYDNHKGGWIDFRPGNKANLFIGMGDGGLGYDPHNNAQNGQVLLGKILRIDVSGDKGGYKIPTDNPFIGSETVRPEVWAMGIRNAYRVSFDRANGDFWIADVGQDSREEINFERADFGGGRNYGWRKREGFIKTPNVGGSKKGMTDPVFDYPHFGQGSLGGCIIGGYVYRGPSIPDADGRYFFGDCVSDRAYSMSFKANGKPIEVREETDALVTQTGLSYFSSFGEDGQGRLYAAGYFGTVVAICASDAKRPPREAPKLAKPGERTVHASVADPCAP